MRVRKDSPGQLVPLSITIRLTPNVANCETREDVKVLTVPIS